MVMSELMKLGLVGGAVMSILGGLAILWDQTGSRVAINPRVEKACHDAVVQKAPLGHRAIITYSYHEEGSKLGVASGSLETQYAPNRWAQVSWTCRVNPEDRQIARIEFTLSGGGQRLKAAASSF